MDLIQFQNNLRSINVWNILVPILEAHFGEIEELNREQLSEGEMADGGAMPDYKQDEYADFKDKYIPTYKIYPTTDLRYTGSFYEQIKASIALYGIEIESFDSKAQELESKYGSLIYGLSEKSLVILKNSIINEFIGSLKMSMLN